MPSVSPLRGALSVVATGRDVRRNGAEPGAVLARIASSHLRVGTFEFAARQGEVLHPLTDYAIARQLPGADRTSVDGYTQSLPEVPRGGRRGAGVINGEVDAHRFRARGHEHRQHDNFGADHRLRSVRLPRRVRSGGSVQLDRPRGPLCIRQSARCTEVEPGALGRNTVATDRFHTRRSNFRGVSSSRDLRRALRGVTTRPVSRQSWVWPSRLSIGRSSTILLTLFGGTRC